MKSVCAWMCGGVVKFLSPVVRIDVYGCGKVLVPNELVSLEQMIF